MKPVARNLSYEVDVKQLHDAIQLMAKTLNLQATSISVWMQAREELHELIDPVEALIEACETVNLADDDDLRRFVFEYLEVDPYYYWSGHIKEKLLTKIKKLDFSEEECEIIRALVLRRIEKRALREFKHICRLIRKVETKGFHESVMDRSKSRDSRVKRRAEFALGYFYEDMGS